MATCLRFAWLTLTIILSARSTRPLPLKVIGPNSPVTELLGVLKIPTTACCLRMLTVTVQKLKRWRIWTSIHTSSMMFTRLLPIPSQVMKTLSNKTGTLGVAQKLIPKLSKILSIKFMMVALLPCFTTWFWQKIPIPAKLLFCQRRNTLIIAMTAVMVLKDNRCLTPWKFQKTGKKRMSKSNATTTQLANSGKITLLTRWVKPWRMVALMVGRVILSEITKFTAMLIRIAMTPLRNFGWPKVMRNSFVPLRKNYPTTT